MDIRIKGQRDGIETATLLHDRFGVPAAAPSAAVTAVKAPLTAQRRGRILVLDDDPMILEALTRILREHEVVCIDDGHAAIAMLDGGERFDIILSDMMMPHMTGMEI